MISRQKIDSGDWYKANGMLRCRELEGGVIDGWQKFTWYVSKPDRACRLFERTEGAS